MIIDQINAEFKKAMIARDSSRLDVIRGIKSAILAFQVDNGSRDVSPDDNSVLDILKKEVKKRTKAIDIYKGINDTVRIEKEEYEISIHQEFMPQSMDEAVLNNYIEDFKNENNLEVVDIKMMNDIFSHILKKEPSAQIDRSMLAKILTSKIQ